MFFRREPSQTLTVSQILSAVRETGIPVEENQESQFVAHRGESVAVIRIEDGEASILRAGRQLGSDIGALVSLGHQTVWRAADGQERAARADELSELHAFLEDLREALGLTSLYNESLGSTHSQHHYDRAVKGK